jgi:hypothetical protein
MINHWAIYEREKDIEILRADFFPRARRAMLVELFFRAKFVYTARSEIRLSEFHSKDKTHYTDYAGKK